MGVARIERLFENGLILGSNLGKESGTVLADWGPSSGAISNNEAIIPRRGNSNVSPH